MTPERIAALEAAAAEEEKSAQAVLASMLASSPDGEPAGVQGSPLALDEEASPVAGRRFSRG
jgi:hypothetical protein